MTWKKYGLVILLSGLSAWAQDITRGSLTGVVKDPTGAVVADALVKVNSPYGDRQTKTNEGGVYTVTNLNAGDGYIVIVEKSGFESQRITGISVGLNSRRTVDVNLQVGNVAQSMEVSGGGGATIDLSTTTVGADLSESLYKNVPVGRSISSVVFLSPGVNDGVGTGQANPSINGASGLENQYIINGANATDPGFGGFGTYSRVFGSLGTGVNFDFIQEVQVKTGGFEAQYGQALGGIINVVTKTGTNAYHGAVYAYFSPRSLAATLPNPNNQLTSKITRNLNNANYDFGGDGGGYFLKDRIFWYAGLNPQLARRYVQADPAFTNYSLGVIPLKTRTYSWVAKVNWNITSKHQLEGSAFGDPSQTNLSFFRGPNSNNNLTESSQDYGSRTWTGRYNGTLTNKWVVSSNYSHFFNQFTESPLANGYQIADITPTQEKRGSNVTFNGLGFIEASATDSDQFAVISSHQVSFFGSHSIDLGYQFENVGYTDTRRYTGANFQLPNLRVFGDQAGATQYGAALRRTHVDPADPTSPIVLRVLRGDTSNPNVATTTQYHAAFIQDAWVANKYVTFKPSLRWEQQSMAGTAFTYKFVHNFAPRMGIIVDPTGSRKQKFFANWGVFFEKVPLDIAVRAFSNEVSVGGTFYRDQPGPVYDLSPANYVGNLYPRVRNAQGTLIGQAPTFVGGADALTFVAPGTKTQYQNEVIAGYERELGNGFTFSGRFVYRHLRRVLEDVSGINVTQANDGAPQQYVITNPSRALDIFVNAKLLPNGNYTDDSGSVAKDGKPDGFPNPSRIYKSMELVVSKRFSTNLQVYANYRLARLYGNYEGNFRNDNGQQDPNISSLFDFTNADNVLTDQYRPGDLPSDRRHVLKFYGNYAFTEGMLKRLNVGTGWYFQSGTPLSRYLSHPAYQNVGEIPDGGRGRYGRTPWTYPLDLHADYTVPLGERFRFKVLADLFNVANQSKGLRFDQNGDVGPGSTNPDFLKKTVYQAGFRARLAIRLEF